jgi:large conductance mechanosensitive channel
MEPLKSFASIAPTKKAFSLLEEFKNFALKGNVIDLAVGVIIGAAFGTIVKSLVDNLMMPLLAALVGTDPASKEGFKSWSWTLRGSAIHYGLFLSDVVNFLIVALALFIFIQKFLGFVLRTKKEEVVAPPPPTRDQELLIEIRDLLKQRPPG